MRNTGKMRRLGRLFDNSGKTIIVPLDHGVTSGSIFGLEDSQKILRSLEGTNAVLMNKGFCKNFGEEIGNAGLIVHLSASTSLSPFPNAKVLVGTVEDALRLNADAVSIHVNLGDQTEGHMLESLGILTSKAAEWGMPVLAMIYARGSKIKSEYDSEIVAHCVRIGAELGADIVKVPYTGDIKTFRKVVEHCHIPVVIAGGPKMDTNYALLSMVHDAIQAGAAGISIGRNVFQHKNPKIILKALRLIVHDDHDIDLVFEKFPELLQKEAA